MCAGSTWNPRRNRQPRALPKTTKRVSDVQANQAVVFALGGTPPNLLMPA